MKRTAEFAAATDAPAGSNGHGHSHKEERPRARIDGEMGRGMLAYAAGQLVFILTGFIMPRLIHDRTGVEMLGVWDFGWSIVSHMVLVGGGMMSAVSRHVARHPVTRDVDALRRLISSCFALFSGLGCAVMLIMGLTAVWLDGWLPDLPAAQVAHGRWVIVLLGLATAVRFPFHVFNGIITGYQRFVLHNLIASAAYLGGILSGLFLLLTGFGVAGLSAGILAGEVGGGVTKLVFARRICPDWRIRPRYVSLQTIREVFHFGSKLLFATAARVMLYQTNTLIVGRLLGVEAIAVFARSRSLVLLLDSLAVKITSVFSPRASQLDAARDRRGVRDTLHLATEYSLFVVLPGVLTLVILGGPLLMVWMGAGFAESGLLAVLALGHLAMLSQRGTYAVLIGLNHHGRPAFYDFCAALLAIALAMLLMGPLQLGLTGAALAIAIPITLSSWLVLPWYACRVLNVSIWQYFVYSSLRPVLLNIPVAIVMMAFRLTDLAPLPMVAGGLGIAGIVYAALFVGFVLTAEQRQRIADATTRLATRLGWPRQPE